MDRIVTYSTSRPKKIAPTMAKMIVQNPNARRSREQNLSTR